LQKKGKVKKTITKRALRAAGQTDLSGNASKDAILMQKLGETIYPMKEDFIMVHLQHSCSHCSTLMVSGKRWVCHQCKSFYICDSCYDSEQRLEEKERHPSNSRDLHVLHPVSSEKLLSQQSKLPQYYFYIILFLRLTLLGCLKIQRIETIS